MNRRGFVATIAGLLGALGLRGQEPPQDTSILKKDWPAYKLKHPDEEYCPLGHSQKPKFIAELPGDDCSWSPAIQTIDWEATKKETQQERDAGIVTMKPPAPCTPIPSTKLVACSVCRVVYVPPEKKPEKYNPDHYRGDWPPKEKP